MSANKQYFAGGDQTGELYVKEFNTFTLFEFWQYKNMSLTQLQANFPNGKTFVREPGQAWKRIA